MRMSTTAIATFLAAPTAVLLSSTRSPLSMTGPVPRCSMVAWTLTHATTDRLQHLIAPASTWDAWIRTHQTTTRARIWLDPAKPCFVGVPTLRPSTTSLIGNQDWDTRLRRIMTLAFAFSPTAPTRRAKTTTRQRTSTTAGAPRFSLAALTQTG